MIHAKCQMEGTLSLCLGAFRLPPVARLLRPVARWLSLDVNEFPLRWKVPYLVWLRLVAAIFRVGFVVSGF